MENNHEAARDGRGRPDIGGKPHNYILNKYHTTFSLTVFQGVLIVRTFDVTPMVGLDQ